MNMVYPAVCFSDTASKFFLNNVLSYYGKGLALLHFLLVICVELQL